MEEQVLLALGDRLREIRSRSGLSQERVAAAAGIGRAYYGKVERGTQNVSLVTAAKICGALEISLSELTQGIPNLATTDGMSFNNSEGSGSPV